jgi:hypothetical protein
MSPPRAPAQKGPPPPPPTRDAPVSKPAHPCPATEPCDVLWLEVITTSSTGVVRKLGTRKRWHDIDPSYAPPAKSGVIAKVGAGLEYLLKSLNSSDFFIETIGDLPPGDATRQFASVLGLSVTDNKPATIQVNAKWKPDSPQHGKPTHPLIEIKPLGRGGDETIVRHMASYGPVPYYANPVFLPGSDTSNPFASFFNFLTSLLAIGGAPKMIDVTARSCGVRAKGEGEANHELVGTVVIYPRDEWGIMVVIPGFGEFKEEQVHSSAVLGGHSEDGFTKSKQLGENATTKSDKLVVDDGVATFTNQKQTQRGSTVKTDTTDDIHGATHIVVTTHENNKTFGSKTFTDPARGKSITEKIDPKQVPHGTLAFKLLRNGEECTVVDKIKELIEGIRSWAEKVSTALELLRRGPTVGWKATATVGIFKCTITGTWARTLGDQDATPNTIWVESQQQRVLAIRNTLSLSFDVTVIEFKLEIAFGFTWMPVTGAFETGIDARIGGDFSLSAHFGGTVNDWSQAEFPFGASAKPNLWIKFRASVAGYAVGAELNVGGGFDVSGKLVFEPGVKGEISGEFKALQMVLTGKVYSTADKVLFKLKDTELLPEYTLGKLG